MEMLIFSVRDDKAEAFLKPFFAPTVAFALRMFTELVNEPDHEFCKHSNDYNLFQIGTFDQATGVIQGQEPYHLGLASVYKDSYMPEAR